jgi:hypothetical protein
MIGLKKQKTPMASACTSKSVLQEIGAGVLAFAD